MGLPEFLAQAEGACCAWAYLVLLERREKTIPSAKRLGISKRTLQKWKKKAREGAFKCEHSRECFLSKLPQPPAQGRDTISELERRARSRVVVAASRRGNGGGRQR